MFVNLLPEDFPLSLVSYSRSLLSFIFLYTFAKAKGYKIYCLESNRVQKYLNIRLLICGFESTLWIFSLTLLPISEVSTIVMTFPFITGVLAYFLLGEQYKMINFKCLVVSFIGILLVAKPHFLFHRFYKTSESEKIYEQRLLGILLCILVSICTAVETIIIRKLKNISNSCN